MAHEIERKFLVDPSWTPPGEGTLFRQGYLSSTPERTVRIRREGATAKLTVKGLTTGVTRTEFEYPIPVADADAMLALCEQPLIDKTRYELAHAGKTWEVDVFHGDNEGLVVAELELASEAEAFDRPAWVRAEVSDDPRYYNANLIKHPFKRW